MEELKNNPHVNSLAEAGANVWRQGWFKTVVVIMVLALTFIAGTNFGGCHDRRNDRQMEHQRSGMMRGGQDRHGRMGMYGQDNRTRPCDGEQNRMMMHNQQNTDCPHRASEPVESNSQAPENEAPVTVDGAIPADIQ